MPHLALVAFTVIASPDSDLSYIAEQEIHHRKITFEEEFRILLEKHCMPFDERYVWD